MLKSYADIAHFFASEPANQSGTFFILQIIVVRIDSNGVDIPGDFVVPQKVEESENLSQIYTPIVALQDFVDSFVQHASSAPVKIIEITLDIPQKKIAIFSTGDGIPEWGLSSWAEPGDMTNST
jgi:hypothetical protein